VNFTNLLKNQISTKLKDKIADKNPLSQVL